jgi:hypothetical protein
MAPLCRTGTKVQTLLTEFFFRQTLMRRIAEGSFHLFHFIDAAPDRLKIRQHFLFPSLCLFAVLYSLSSSSLLLRFTIRPHCGYFFRRIIAHMLRKAPHIARRRFLFRLTVHYWTMSSFFLPPLADCSKCLWNKAYGLLQKCFLLRSYQRLCHYSAPVKALAYTHSDLPIMRRVSL